MDAALVELVEHDRPEVLEQRVLLETGGQDAFGRKEHFRARAKAPLEPDVPPDFVANRPSLLFSDTFGQAPRGDAPRLQDDDRPIDGKGWRNARRLAGSWRRDDDHRARLTSTGKNLGDEWVDRQAECGHVGILRSRPRFAVRLLAAGCRQPGSRGSFTSNPSH